MHFTREPIIESIVTPKEGYKLSIKNSKGGSGEEFLVDAVEIISFGQTFFYRSMERPKSFMVPVSDYEISEVKELRLVVKNPNIDRAIKIAGGKESNQQGNNNQQQKQQSGKQQSQEQKNDSNKEAANSPKKERKRQKRGRRSSTASTANEEKEKQSEVPTEQRSLPLPGKVDDSEDVIAPASIFSGLLTPPQTLISESLMKSPPPVDTFVESGRELDKKPKEKDENLKVKETKNLETPVNNESITGKVSKPESTVTDSIDDAELNVEKDQAISDVGLVSEEPKVGDELEEHDMPPSEMEHANASTEKGHLDLGEKE